MIRVHLRVSGRVHGVFFRVEAARQAEQLGLAGWVRNRKDGTVEAVAEGEEPAVREFVTWCGQGPTAARVTDIEVVEQAPVGLPPVFQVRSSV